MVNRSIVTVAGAQRGILAFRKTRVKSESFLTWKYIGRLLWFHWKTPFSLSVVSVDPVFIIVTWDSEHVSHGWDLLWRLTLWYSVLCPDKIYEGIHTIFALFVPWTMCVCCTPSAQFLLSFFSVPKYLAAGQPCRTWWYYYLCSCS